MTIPWAWFAMRASGLVAVGLLTASVVLGIVGPRLRPTARLAAITMHRAASVAGVMLIAAHVGLAVLDQWVPLDWPAALLPGVAGWERWGVALGALAIDLTVVLVVTTTTRLRWPRLWRRAHLAAYPVWALAVGHGLLVGSDGTAMRALALASTSLVLLAVGVRRASRPPMPGPAAGTPAAELAGGTR